jgi:hypothetical protein
LAVLIRPLVVPDAEIDYPCFTELSCQKKAQMPDHLKYMVHDGKTPAPPRTAEYLQGKRPLRGIYTEYVTVKVWATLAGGKKGLMAPMPWVKAKRCNRTDGSMAFVLHDTRLSHLKPQPKGAMGQIVDADGRVYDITAVGGIRPWHCEVTPEKPPENSAS